jgi:hypothetical protein
MNEFDDEIQFKPLSEGLGFHQKKIPLQANHLDFSAEPRVKSDFKIEPKSMVHSQTQIKEDKSSLVPVWNKSATKVQNSWAGHIDLGLSPQEDGLVDRDSLNSNTSLNNPFYNPLKPVSPVEVVTLKFSGHDGLKKDKSKPNQGSVLAIMMDVLTLISLCMIFMTLYFSVRGQSFTEVIMQLPYNVALKNQFVSLTLSIGFLYLIVSRCLFGRTIGEWMFHLQLGSLKDQEKHTYPVKVFIRTLLVFLTGFLLFPILSVAFKKDFLVYFTGLELHVESYS